MSLENRTCVVTGGSRGIGRGIAQQLGKHGANVAVNYYWSDEEAREVADWINDHGGNAISVQADVTSTEQVEAMWGQIHDEFGGVNVVVNNAGITVDTKFEHMNRDEWDRVMEVTLGGTFNVTRCFFHDIKNAEDGRLICISSVIGKQGNYGQANYAAAKSGLFGFTRSLALELAPHNSTANCVAPGYTKTDMLEDVSEDVLDQIRRQIPLKRFATVDEIASVVRFLAGPESSYVTGEVIDVNGAYDL